MKERAMAIVLLVVVIISVVTNTLLLCSKLDHIIYRIERLNFIETNNFETKTEAEEIYKEYQDYYLFLGLTVSHDDLTNIDNCFVELLGYISINNFDEATVAQSRLINSLEHLRRLCGFNIEAII